MSESHLTSEQLTLILDSIPEALCLISLEDRKIIFANKKLEELVGYELTGKICYKSFQQQKEPCCFCSNISLVNPSNSDNIYQRFDSVSNKYYKCTNIIFQWTDDRLVRLGIAVDITDEKENREREMLMENIIELRKAVAELRNKRCDKCKCLI